MFAFLKRKKKELNLPGLFFEVDDDGDITVRANWIRPENEEELLQLVNKLAGLIMILHQGRLLPVIQHAVSAYGENHNDSTTAKAVLITLNKLQNSGKQFKKPLVMPSTAFRGQKEKS